MNVHCSVHGNANLGGFDYEVWLLEQDLRATGTVRSDDASDTRNVRVASFVWSFNNVVERARGWMRDRILAALPDKKYAGVIVALVVGDERGVGQSDWRVFNRTGVGHLIAISGLHITLIAGMCARLMYALWARSFFTRAELPLLLPAHKAAALTAVAVGFIYVFLAGFGVPAQRTLYMLTVVAVALWFGRLASVSHIACIALGAVLLLDPWAVLWPGFWLSFGCVAIILFATLADPASCGRHAVAQAALVGAPQDGRAHAAVADLGPGAVDDAAVRPGIDRQSACQCDCDSAHQFHRHAAGLARQRVAGAVVRLVVMVCALLHCRFGASADLDERAAGRGVDGAGAQLLDLCLRVDRRLVAAGAARHAVALAGAGRLAAFAV